MLIDPATAAVADVYHHLTAAITPRPIAWVSSLSPKGVANLAPFSFFNGVGANPPAVVFSPVNRVDGSPKDTLVNIEAMGEFVVNIVSEPLAKVMNASSWDYPPEVSEFIACNLTSIPSQKIKPPRLKESHVSFECVLHQVVKVGAGSLAANVVIGRIVLMHISDAVVDPAGRIDPAKLDTVGRMGASLYTRTRDRFAMPRPTSEKK